MDSPNQGGGCIGVIMFIGGFIAALLFGPPIGSIWSSVTLDLSGNQPVSVLTMTFAVTPNASKKGPISDQLAQTNIVLLTRLGQLKQAGLLTAYQAPTIYLATNTIEITVNPVSADSVPVVRALSERGFFELVDVAALTPNQIYALENQVILTSALQQRYGLTTGKATGNGKPFTTVVTSDEIVATKVIRSVSNNSWDVQVDFTPQGSTTVQNFTAENIGKPLAIALDGRVLSAPVIYSEIRDTAVIASNMSQSDAQILALQIRSKPLPVTLSLQSISSMLTRSTQGMQ